MSVEQEELADDIHERVTELSEQGNDLLDAGNETGAIRCWQSAIRLLPEPHHKWDAALWLYASIGDAQRQQGDMESALSSFQRAAASSDGHANGFVQLGIGTCLYDLGHQEESTDPLLRAYMAEGEEIFEESDAKYLNYLRMRKLVS
ncbi:MULTISPECIES: tetratricopeptide repeat protein [Rhizobium]|uniref:Tetratricopeptide repeat protein n=1 Tax=Rhizobium rhododendri TaxID=2506430 RepID=A0ABY8IKY2_9HYPH|nr:MULTISPECIES: tetratricopeptide repeat protein [Rhizobium]MBZ5758106.1 tetratricopeptide repeat protein [Rhizobium sp. VS19-DR96]MBZ5765064.1 tetratricopeptide repeat protein [Rhizobium sp. VS19-DR129.2]MBZ5772607.1 tetratricopeptide repeat protein [Rhizobium sp. VS19-DRK62.2]MBZ5782706.1 tetratricopeptide repeat protein [Rhizobium sp. VS19-DR121]MBZ5800154.1 tetratricopeptide repeat protein [Rhizobium sp. VS19-DR181]